MKRFHIFLLVLTGFAFYFSFVPSSHAKTEVNISFGSPVYQVRPYSYPRYYYPPRVVYYEAPVCDDFRHSHGRHHHYPRKYVSYNRGYEFDNMYGPGSSAAGRMSPVRTSNIYYGY